jgi:glycosyltransferase involved in cell wall biosynthesis
VISDRKEFEGSIFNKGALLNDGIAFALKEYGVKWILLTDSDIIFPDGFRKQVVGKIYNPGTLYFAERLCVEPEKAVAFASAPINLIRYRQEDAHSNLKAWGYFQLFNVDSSRVRGRAPAYYSEEYLSAGYVDKEFLNLWPKERRHFTGIRVVHINHGGRGKNWHG